MALLPHDAKHLSLLVKSLTSADSSPQQVQTIVSLIRQCGLQDQVDVRASFEDVTCDPDMRFPALAADIALKQGSGDWSKFDGLMISGLQAQPSASIDAWLNVLQPAGPQFVDRLKEVLTSATDANKAVVLAKALHGFLNGQDREHYFLAAIQSANAAQFSGLLNAMEEGGTAKQMIPVLTAALTQTATDSSHANLCVALFRLGIDQPLMEMYRGGIEDQRSLVAVFASKPDRINAYQLISLYDRARLFQFGEPGLRRSVLQALAHQAPGLVDEDLRQRLCTIARQHVENDPDACCFSTAELILTRLGAGSRKEWRALRRAKTPDGILGNVLIDRAGNAFSIQQNETAKLAVSTTELTAQALFEYCTAAGIDQKLKASDLPFEISRLRDIKLVLEYCNWLSKQNQFGEDQLCYPPSFGLSAISTISPKIGAPGYRLPSVAEYRELNAKNSPLLRLKMDSKAVVLDYAWGFQNSGAVVQPVGTLLPNALGVFDSLGNVQELSQSQYNLDTEWHAVGQTVRSEAGGFSIEQADLQQVVSNIWTRVGFRIVRRID
jgi:hypothetical protein